MVALAAYVLVGFWIRFDLHFWINDALSRSADAVYVTIGRDPHLGAIGFYWPPLPQLIQCPLVALLEPFDLTQMAGPLSSAICLALTIPLLARLCRMLGTGRGLTFAICLSFAFNPIIVYYAGIGMSEACAFMALTITLIGFFGYIRSHSTPDLVILSAGLSAGVLTRLEGPFLAAALAIIAGVEWHTLRQTTKNVFLIGTWMLIQWLLLGSPLFFLHQNSGGGLFVHSVSFPYVYHNPFLTAVWVAHWVPIFGLALLVVVADVIINPLSTRLRGNLGLLGGMGVFLAIQGETLFNGTGTANPRYFVMGILFATAGVAWLSINRPGIHFRVWNASLVCLLVIGGGIGSYTETSGSLTHVEDECAFFQWGVAKVVPLLGRSQATAAVPCTRPGNTLKAWQDLSNWLDPQLKPRDRVYADNADNYAAVLYTRHPNQYVVRNDRDWQKITDNPDDGEITYIVTQAIVRGSSTSAAPEQPIPGSGLPDQGAIIVDLDPKAWKLVNEFGDADYNGQRSSILVYKFVGVR
jgi:hypothetical protein